MIRGIVVRENGAAIEEFDESFIPDGDVLVDVAWSDLAAGVRRAAGPVLRDLLLFDRYQGPGVESGCKSLAMGLILQDNTRTLTDQDADAVVARVVAELGSAHGARIRG